MSTNEKKGKHLGFYFSLAMSLLIAAAIVITAFYSIRCINSLLNDYEETSVKYTNYISKIVVTAYENDLKEGGYKNVMAAVAPLRQDDFIQYAYIYNPDSGEVLWSSESDYKNVNIKNILSPRISKKSKIEQKDLSFGAYHLLLGITKNKSQNDGYNEMIGGLKLFVILFLLLSIVISAYVSQLVSRPIKDVVSGVQEFGKGNLEYQLAKTGFEEVDKLVDAYNEMATQLNVLYKSLEAKVEERTFELKEANKKLKETQTMMVHSEKMRSLGELVAGIAHEINNPINFIYGNIMILDNYQKDLLELINKYSLADSQIAPEIMKEISEHKEKIDLDFIKDDIGDLIKSCLEGVERTKNIILDLKNFSRMDEMVFSECNIPKEIDTILNILNNKMKNRITIHKDYEENLPKIEAYGGQINQVFMNIIDNAQGAIKGVGDIYLTVKKFDENNISVVVEDTGCGIKPENIHKIFEPFFTTKPVGQGTGLGMSIAYRVVEAHRGKINIESEIDKGTKVTVILPILHKTKGDDVK